MSRKSHFFAVFLLFVSFAGANGNGGGPNVPSTGATRTVSSSDTSATAGNVVKILKKAPSQDNLRSFFNSDIKPLSFSDFSQPPSMKREIERIEAVKPPTPIETPSFGPAMSFSAGTGSMTDNILQGIRDLRLTLSEMDEKLDRVVQKVAPTDVHPSGMMRKGADMFKKFLHIPTSIQGQDSGAKGLKRSLVGGRWRGSDEDSDEEGNYEAGIGLRNRFRG